MRSTVRARFWLEAGVAWFAGLLGVLSFFWRDWVEAIGFDPDHHSGSFEWAIVAGLFLVCVMVSVVARVEWHARGRSAAAEAEPSGASASS